MRSSSSFCFVMVWTNWFSSMFMAGSLSKEWLRRNTHSKDLEPAALKCFQSVHAGKPIGATKVGNLEFRATKSRFAAFHLSRFVDSDARFAMRAMPDLARSAKIGGVGSPENDLRFGGTVKAGLTNIVLGFRDDLAVSFIEHGPARCAIHELSGAQFEKRVTTAFRKDFIKFSKLLCSLEVLLLQVQQLRVVREQALLGIEKLFVHTNDDLVQLVGVADLDSRFSDVERGAQGADCTSDQRQIHACSPNVEKGGVGASDSTLRGNARQEGIDA